MPLYPPAVTPASPTDSVQYNNSGAFGGSANLTFNGSVLTVDGTVALDDQTPIHLGQSTMRIFGSTSGDFLNIINDKEDGAIFITPDTGGMDIGNSNGPMTIRGSGIQFIANNIEYTTPLLILATSVNALSVSDDIGPYVHLRVDTTFDPQPNVYIGDAIDAVGFFGKTPIVQPTTSSGAASFTANSGTAVNDASTFDGYTLKQVVKALRDIGILA